MEMTLKELVSKIGTRKDYLTATMQAQYNPRFDVRNNRLNKATVWIQLPGLSHVSCFYSDTKVIVNPLCDEITIVE